MAFVVQNELFHSKFGIPGKSTYTDCDGTTEKLQTLFTEKLVIFTTDPPEAVLEMDQKPEV
ncbi:MAG: hypothetical protein SGARI_007200, partial [Bacillariaceae sp.]